MSTYLKNINKQINYTIDHICFEGPKDDELERAISTLRLLRSIQLEQQAIYALDKQNKRKNKLTA